MTDLTDTIADLRRLLDEAGASQWRFVLGADDLGETDDVYGSLKAVLDESEYHVARMWETSVRPDVVSLLLSAGMNALPALLDRAEAVDRLIAEIERDREIAVRVGASAECSRLTQYLDLLRGKEDAS